MAWPLIAAAVLGAIGGAIGGKKRPKSRTWYEQLPRAYYLPPGFEFFGGTAGPGGAERTEDFVAAITEYVRAAKEGLPPEVLQRRLATIAAGMGIAQESAGRSAALGFGPTALTPSMAALSQARLGSQTQASNALANLQVRQQMTNSLLDFFSRIESIRAGTPYVTTTTGPNKGATAGAFQGAAQGIGLGSMFGGGGGGSTLGSRPGEGFFGSTSGAGGPWYF